MQGWEAGVPSMRLSSASTRAVKKSRMLGWQSARNWRGLRIQPLDQAGVTLVDHAALELERKRQFAAVKGEFAVEQGEALDGFKLRQIRAQPLDLSFDQIVHPRTRNQLLWRSGLDSRLSGARLHGGKVRHDQRGNIGAAIPHQNRI